MSKYFSARVRLEAIEFSIFFPWYRIVCITFGARKLIDYAWANNHKLPMRSRFSQTFQQLGVKTLVANTKKDKSETKLLLNYYGRVLGRLRFESFAITLA